MGKPRLGIKSIKMGCDPEFFFTKNGKVIGSERVLGRGKGKVKVRNFDGEKVIYEIVTDGVQGELHAYPDTCRQLLSSKIAQALYDLRQKLKGKGIKIELGKPNFKVTKKELMGLSSESRQFGCAPSYNAYETGECKIDKDGLEYRWRSAGGHIHLSYEGLKGERLKNIIKIMDLILGIPSVLLDRSKRNKERRETYGKAGEYRETSYGFEYRTLTNFWLRRYELMSLVFNLARTGLSIGLNAQARNHLLKIISEEEVKEAINNNNYMKAKSIYKKVRDYVQDIFTRSTSRYILAKNNVGVFDYFLSKGLNYWFKPNADFISLWSKNSGMTGDGFENFLKNVEDEMDENNISVSKFRL